ncbi:hypothetical protein [Rhizobium sp. Root1220]|uniref:hypothetical protein n=1 Tax=Rhizobium sp. Root1220 TaxID=1736432 RepID=UPI0012E3CA3F|nr:hypothetical protein [Rhizobium sp. Root1220]
MLTQTIVDTVNTLESLTRRVISEGQGRRTSEVDIAANGSSVTTASDAASGKTLSMSRANDPLNARRRQLAT